MSFPTFSAYWRQAIVLLAGFLVLVGFTYAAYYPATKAGAILDDEAFYIQDPLIGTTDGLYRIWFHPFDNNGIWSYVPISRTTFWLERQLWGLNLSITHRINVIFHLVSAIILWLALRQFGMRGAWWAAMIFALHPIHVQSVAWIAERRNVVASIFYISCIWSYLYSDHKHSQRWYWIAVGLFLCALLSKTSTIMLPVILIFGRMWLKSPWNRSDLIRLFPFFFLSLLMAAGRIWFESVSLGAQRLPIDLTFLERLLLAGHIPFFYLTKLVYPYPLIFTYPSWDIQITDLSMYFPIISVLVVAGVSIWKYQAWAFPIFIGLGAFLATLFPVLGFFQIAWTQFSFVTDHWVYLPSLPIIVLASQGILKMMEQPGTSRIGHQYRQTGVIGILLIGFGVLTWKQTQIYQNQKTLWEATLQHNSNSWVAHTVLGLEYLQEGKYQRALEYSNQALALKSDNIFATISRGRILFHMQQYEKAIEDYNRALQIDPQSTVAHFHRGNAFSENKQYQQAIKDYNQVIKIDPEHLLSYYNRAFLFFSLKQYDDAVRDYTEVLRINPKFVEGYYNRGSVYFYQNQYEKALEDYTKALELNPDYSDAHQARELIYQHIRKK
ncbi:MAG: tetratricopeptide repeat protein [SAR324 cluster bacterium]|nr:tetratricopeptide repeat protein [SAR324 cluster bacterium]